MVDASTTGPEPGQDTPQRLFRTLGFSFVHWFLRLVLWGCFLALTGGLVLGWVLEGDITVKAKGAVRPTSRHLVKSAVDGRVDEVCVSAGDRVAEDDILVVLSPQGMRGRLTQVEAELDLSDSRSERLAAQSAITAR